MKDSTKLVSIVLGSYNRLRYLKLALATVRNEMADSGLTYEIIVVDGGSTDGSMAWLCKQKDIITIVQHNRGKWRGRSIERRSWGYFMNLGFKIAQGKHICMISDDCLVVPGAIRNGVAFLERELAAGKKIGGVAFYWRNWPELGDYWVGLTFGGKMILNHGLLLRNALQEIGFIDEDSYSFYHADGDLCLRLWKAGYEIVDCPQSFIEHHGDANTRVRQGNLERQHRDWLTYSSRWEPVFGPITRDNVLLEFSDPAQTSRFFGDARLEILKRRVWRRLARIF